ncbi:hypothetical protein MPTK1_4g04240 [Marchantia polymorpha subsp. ruderalis]|uniref:Uncharacterized protein n=2 Tax=Marchantia polymorpha TaxID=3197 RepID=A0AAF6B685_MARPO|nr:hypothetical protein MARPO_0044s0049 [Marchantia polymorpha]BBN07519.1 hypothetical protein Mp_4g04240 [Marchantia polymorpha subsp. ruderalis]|eukprot:PTQ39581.1 hypothetical protein MARPO_0044s0049 [Marchantia polymorpha]
MAALQVCVSAVKQSVASPLMRSNSKVPCTARTLSVLPVLPRVARKRCGVARAAGTADENICPDSLPANFSCVDANMVTLRRRIEGVRVKESFMHTPEEWMEWERSCYNTYRADVNVLVATLQSHLLSMRPSVVLSIISLLFAIAPVAALLFFSALGGQLYSMNNALLDMLSSTSTTY